MHDFLHCYTLNVVEWEGIRKEYIVEEEEERELTGRSRLWRQQLDESVDVVVRSSRSCNAAGGGASRLGRWSPAAASREGDNQPFIFASTPPFLRRRPSPRGSVSPPGSSPPAGHQVIP
jgi:hypothetical protein